MRIIIEIDERTTQVVQKISEESDMAEQDGGMPADELLAEASESGDVAGDDMGGPPEWLVSAITQAEQQDASDTPSASTYASADSADGGAAPTNGASS